MKSHSSDYLQVMQAIYEDACVRCAVQASIRDINTIVSRVECQGLSFLTITLPNFCADFERSLEQGFVGSNLFRSFRKRRLIPAFLQGIVSQIFNIETGRINDELPPHELSRFVESVRQICLAFKKIKLPCTENRVRKSLDGFVTIENELSMFTLPETDRNLFEDVVFVLWSGILANIRLDQLQPRHGPGQTANKISGNQKFLWREWYERLEPYFPFLGTGYSTSSGISGDLGWELDVVSFIPEDQETPVKVTPVPKTLKGPRIIAIEPPCMQFVQQGIRRAITARIESHWRTGGRINFSDQTVNQRLAMSSSLDRRLATIDLSDASDRVPRSLAISMFDFHPDLRDAIDACRSRTAKLPNGTLVPLSKFASMGSALCFPVEAMYFYTICVVALLAERSLPVSRSNVDLVASDVYVYGDDIIVPSTSAATVLDHLRKYNCKVNDRKTFYRGFFRESCGVDAYGGVQVTPVYLGTAPPLNRRSSKELISWTSAANHFYKKGYLRTSQLLFGKVEKILGKLPSVPETAPCLGRNHPWPFVPRKRFNKRYQRLEILAWVPRPIYRTDKIGGYAALEKSLTRLSNLSRLDAPRDRRHLERSALRGEVALKRQWVPAT